MVFTSPIFLFWFLPLVLAAYYLAPRALRTLLLTAASCVFYGWWRADFVFLMLLSAAVDYGAGAAIARAAAAGDLGRKRMWLGLSLVANLGLLGYFKYANFGIDTANEILRALGFGAVDWPRVVLPVGISFYTFQTMSYTIDVYRGEVQPVRSFVDFACYVTLFPQLVAGPIVRYRSVAEQIVQREHTFAGFARGVLLFEIGFCKKVLLADPAGAAADAAFALADPTAAEAWFGAFAYALQIYFDFSGYSDMAIGLGRLFGFEFPVNFDSPYRSASITEFWRRWHISLSTWLRDYLYVPLGGNRAGPRRTYVNLMATMLLGGLWHGAAWTFVAWGAYQGVWLVLERLLGKRPPWARLPRPLQVVPAFAAVLVGWVLFRSATLAQASAFIGAMFGAGAPLGLEFARIAVAPLSAFALGAGALVVWLAPNSTRIAQSESALGRSAFALLFPLAVCQLLFTQYSPFLYFQF